MAAAERRWISTLTITATDEANDANDETKAGHRRRNPGGRVHAADGTHSVCVSGGNGSSTQTCQRAVQRSARRDGGDGSDSVTRVRKQPRILAQRPAAQ